MREWRQHWRTRSFFQALVFGLLFTLLDTGTDLSFAWSVPEECPDRWDLSSPCGLIFPENVEALTYTFIALPGILLSFSAFQSLVAGLAARCCCCRGGKICETLQAVANFVVLLIQGFISIGLFFAAASNSSWTEEVPPGVGQVYGFTIKAMAYASAIFVISVKFLGAFCHGPQATRLVLRATHAETRYEAANQLALVATIYLNSGTWTTKSLLSAMTSILVIGKVGVQSFFEELEQDRKLAGASLLDRFSVGTSVLPAFVLTALFKLGSIAILFATDGRETENAFFWILLALAPPALVILLLKTCLLLEDLSVADISQGVVAELVSLHLWPCGQIGKRIGLGVTVFKVLLFTTMLTWVIINPNNGDLVGLVMSNPEAYTKWQIKWATETSSRLQIASISCLVIGWISLPLILGQVFFQDMFITNCLSAPEEEEEEEEQGIEMKVVQGEVKETKQENEIKGETEVKLPNEMRKTYQAKDENVVKEETVVEVEIGAKENKELLEKAEETEENENKAATESTG